VPLPWVVSGTGHAAAGNLANPTNVGLRANILLPQ
jgi:hypothetical protein